MLEGALRYDKDNVVARLNLGDAYRLLGKAGDAKKQLEWVASKDSSNAQVHYDLGLLYLFSDSIPGVDPKTAMDKAVDELNLYKKMKPKGKAGEKDDTDELITRAKTKKAVMEENAKAAAKAKTTSSSSSGAKPASTGSSTGKLPPAGGKK
jgi:tetratricopeptide (TPR) repeat protein